MRVIDSGIATVSKDKLTPDAFWQRNLVWVKELATNHGDIPYCVNLLIKDELHYACYQLQGEVDKVALTRVLSLSANLPDTRALFTAFSAWMVTKPLSGPTPTVRPSMDPERVESMFALSEFRHEGAIKRELKIFKMIRQPLTKLLTDLEEVSDLNNAPFTGRMTGFMK